MLAVNTTLVFLMLCTVHVLGYSGGVYAHTRPSNTSSLFFNLPVMVYLVSSRAIHRKCRYEELNWFARVASINSSEVCTQIRFNLKFKILPIGVYAQEQQ